MELSTFLLHGEFMYFVFSDWFLSGLGWFWTCKVKNFNLSDVKVVLEKCLKIK